MDLYYSSLVGSFYLELKSFSYWLDLSFDIHREHIKPKAIAMSESLLVLWSSVAYQWLVLVSPGH